MSAISASASRRIAGHIVVQRDHVSPLLSDSWQAATTSGSAGTDSRISTTVVVDGSSVTSPLISVSRVQFTNARRPSHNTSSPISSVRSSVARDASSVSPWNAFSRPSRNSSSYPKTFSSRSKIGCRATYRNGFTSRTGSCATVCPAEMFSTFLSIGSRAKKLKSRNSHDERGGSLVFLCVLCGCALCVWG